MKAKAITAGVAVALSLATLATSTAFSTGTTSKANQACTSRLFRNVARQVLHPWWEKAHGRYRMRRLVGCAANERTRRQMKRTRENQEAGKRKAVERYHYYTPYPGCGELGRSAIPTDLPERESGCIWDKWNNAGSSACGPYQLFGHGQPCHPYPDVVRGMKEKMQHHIIAHDLYIECGETSCGWGASA